MNKTKFGIPFSFFIAAIYFSALKNEVLPVLLLSYAVLAEGEALRKAAAQAIYVLGSIWGVLAVYQLLDDFISLANSSFGAYLHMPYGLEVLLHFLADAVLFTFGILALLGKSEVIKENKVEDTLRKLQTPKAVAQKKDKNTAPPASSAPTAKSDAPATPSEEQKK